MDAATDETLAPRRSEVGGPTTGPVRGARLLALALALEVVALTAIGLIAVEDHARIRFELVVVALGVGVALVTLVWPILALASLRTRHRSAAGLSLGRAFVALPLAGLVALTTPFLILGFRTGLGSEPGLVIAFTIAFLTALAAEILYFLGGLRVWYAMQGSNRSPATYADAEWLEEGEQVQLAARSRGKYRVEGRGATYMLYADFVLTDRRLAILTGRRQRKLTTELRPEHIRAVSVETTLRMRGTVWRPMGKRVLVLQVHKDDKDATFGVALDGAADWSARIEPWAAD